MCGQHPTYIYIYIYIYIIQDVPETPAEKKARLAMERVQIQKTAKVAEGMVKLATGILYKVSPILASLNNLLAKSELQMLPMIIRTPLEQFQAKFREYEENAREVIASDGAVSAMVDDLKDPFEINSVCSWWCRW
jgi:hypothetical protein